MRDPRTRLLLAERVKRRENTFLAPLIPALSEHYDLRFVTDGPGRDLADAIAWSDVVWLEWCWDHAVWATRTDVLAGRPCILRLHSIEALQTNYPARVDWNRITCLTTVGQDITSVLLERCPAARRVPLRVIPNGIDLDRFRPGDSGQPGPDRFRIGWVGHVEPKKNPMLMVQIAHQLRRLDSRYTIAVAGALTDLRTARYLQRMIARLGLGDMIRFDGPVADMPAWYRDKGVLLSTTMYESFGLNIAEAMAVGAFPVIHDFPGADLLWPPECLFAGIDEAVSLIRAGRPGLYREWIAERYDLDRQSAAILDMVAEVATGCEAGRGEAAGAKMLTA